MTKEGTLAAHRIIDCFRDIPNGKWTLDHSKRIETGPNDPVPCSILQRASFRSKEVLVNFDFFSGHFQMFGFMHFQLFGLFAQLNALPDLPNEAKNVPCATGHLPGPLGPATAQRRPTFLHRRIFGLLGLRGRFEITPKSESPNETGQK